MGEGGGGEHELPLYVRADIDDEGEDVSTPAQDTAALVLGVSAGGFALVGDVLIPTHAGQAFVWMALTVVVVSVAVVANRSRGDPGAGSCTSYSSRSSWSWAGARRRRRRG